MLDVRCDRCEREIMRPGALIFNPPSNETLLVEKYHICVDCWPTIVAMLNDKPQDKHETRA
jgi:hypothetical protein